MYPIEHYMKTLKGYVKNKARPEGNMVEGYAIEEALGFCIEYLRISQPQNERCGMTKKTHVWLMRWLKEIGAHEFKCRLSRHGPLFSHSKCGADGSMAFVIHYKSQSQILLH
jgi:hypothetical protein